MNDTVTGRLKSKAIPTDTLSLFLTKGPLMQIKPVYIFFTVVSYLFCYRKRGCVMVSTIVPGVKMSPSVSLSVKKISSDVEMLVATI